MTELEMVPGLIAEGAQSIVDNASRLGLTWALRPATVFDPNGPSARYDGDSEPIGMISMIGPVSADDRVYVIEIPSGGNYIVGTTQVRGPIGANSSNNGTLVTTGAAETAVASASWDFEPVFPFEPGQLYRLVATLALDFTSAGSLAVVRIRKGQATTSGTQLCYWEVSRLLAGAGEASTLIGYIKNTTATLVETKLSVTIDHVAGAAGNVRIIGDSNRPAIVAVEYYASVAARPDIADLYPSV